jgi:hypothetical protein
MRIRFRIRIPNTALVLARRWNLPVGRISQPELGSRPEDFSIYLPRIMELARANGDLKPPSGRDGGEGSTEAAAASPLPPPGVSARASRPEERILAAGKRFSEAEERIVAAGKRSSVPEDALSSSAKKTRTATVINTYVEPANVVDVSDSDDDIGEFLCLFCAWDCVFVDLKYAKRFNQFLKLALFFMLIDFTLVPQGSASKNFAEKSIPILFVNCE